MFAAWLRGQNEGRPVRFEKVEPGDEQILEDWEQRDLDGVPSFLALRDDELLRDEPWPGRSANREAWNERREPGFPDPDR